MGISAPNAPNLPTAQTGKLGSSSIARPTSSAAAAHHGGDSECGRGAHGEHQPGDYVLSVDGVAITLTSLDSVLAYKVGKRVAERGVGCSGAGKREVAVRPRSTAFEKQMLYRAWIEERRAMVAKLSNGRLGYVHMFDMGGGALAQLNLDLDSEMHEKDAVVFDVRNNNGGFVNGYALDVLSRAPYVNMVLRGVPSVPGRPVLGKRALEKQTILITSQATLSDGENFTEGYRTMKLGTRWSASRRRSGTSRRGGTMVDGRSCGFHSCGTRSWTTRRSSVRHVRSTSRSIGRWASYTGHDAQLERAVQELLNQLRGSRGRSRAGSRVRGAEAMAD
jgi:hypothetical protein